MADVIPFPTKAVRDWREIEVTIRAALRDAHLPQAGIDAVVARMKPFVALCSREFSFSADDPETFAKKIHLFTSELLLDRLKVEIELYAASNGYEQAPDDA